jgi:hypothetical protein
MHRSRSGTRVCIDPGEIPSEDRRRVLGLQYYGPLAIVAVTTRENVCTDAATHTRQPCAQALRFFAALSEPLMAGCSRVPRDSQHVVRPVTHTHAAGALQARDSLV